MRSFEELSVLSDRLVADLMERRSDLAPMEVVMVCALAATALFTLIERSNPVREDVPWNQSQHDHAWAVRANEQACALVETLIHREDLGRPHELGAALAGALYYLAKTMELSAAEWEG